MVNEMEPAQTSAPAPAPAQTQPQPPLVQEGTADFPQELAGLSLSMRIPSFWRDKPRLWFVSFEAATSELRRSQTQLTQLVIAKLEKQDVEQIADLLHDPPTTEQYTTLKNRLISVYEESDNRQLQRLLQEMELGDQKPSQLLRRMKSLARDKIPEATLRILWANLLPPHVRSVLAVSESVITKTTFDELALVADRMLEASISTQISAVEPTPVPTNPATDTKLIFEEIRKLASEVAALKVVQSPAMYSHNNGQYASYRSSYRPTRPTQNRRFLSTRSRSPTPSPHCYFHRRFGQRAYKCAPPCSFKRERDSKSEN